MNDDMKIINKFLKSKNENMESIKELSGGTNNRIYSVNDKYFVKFKDSSSIMGEKYFFSIYQSNLYPKILDCNIEKGYIIYNLLDAKDAENANEIENIIDIVYNESVNRKVTLEKGYGYVSGLRHTWTDFLKNELDDSIEYLKSESLISKFDLNIINSSLKIIEKYPFEKRVIHGDFGLHNIMISNNKSIIIIDPSTVIGDYLYDFIFFCFSDVTLLKLISFQKIFDLLNEDYEKVKAMMIIVLFIRTQRALKYSKSDFPYYYKKYEELIKL